MDELLFIGSTYLALFALLAATGCGLPLPEEAVIVGAGMLSGDHRLNAAAAFITCVLGVAAGDLAMYAAGYSARHWSKEMGNRVAATGASRFALRLFGAASRYPLTVMLLSHFTIGLRPLMYFTLGARRVPRSSFAVAETICALLITSVCFWPSYVMGSSVLEWFQSIGIGLTGAVGLVVLASTVLLWMGVNSRNNKSLPTGYPNPPDDSNLSD